MASITRDTRFRNSFQYFMTNHPIYEDLEYEIRCNTKNTRNNNHTYDILFPLEKQIGVIDSEGGKISKPIYMEQNLPTNITAINDFKEFYEPYMTYCNDMHMLISGTYITNIDEMSENNKVSIVSLEVKYPINQGKHKTQIVMPYRLSPDQSEPKIQKIPKIQNIQNSYINQINILQEDNCHLLRQNSILNSLNDKNLEYIDTLITRNATASNLYMTELAANTVYIQSIIQRFNQNIFATHENYIKLNNNYCKLIEKHNIIVEQDCPVCYDQLNPTNLASPACGHLICSDCIVKCNSMCPLCRDDYNGFDDIFIPDEE